MNAVEKFVDFLENIQQYAMDEYFEVFLKDILYKSDNRKDVQELVTDIEMYLATYRVKRENWATDAHFLGDFVAVSGYLENSPLKLKEMLEVILYTIEMNLATKAIENDRPIIDLDAVFEYDYKVIPIEKVRDIILNGNLVQYFNTDIRTLSALEVLERAELYSVVNNSKIDGVELMNTCTSIYDLLIKGRKTLTIDKLDKALKLLQKLGVTDTLIDSLREYLEREILKRELKEEKSELYIPCERVVSKKKYLTEKEYSQLKKEVYKYYNIYKVEFTHELTFEEVIYVASLMIKMGLEKDEIINLFRKYYRSIDRTIESITDCLNGLDKLEFYFSNEELDYLKDSLKEISICSHEDYEFWKKEIISNTMLLDNKIKDKFEYEYSLTKTYKK